MRTNILKKRLSSQHFPIDELRICMWIKYKTSRNQLINEIKRRQRLDITHFLVVIAETEYNYLSIQCDFIQQEIKSYL